MSQQATRKDVRGLCSQVYKHPVAFENRVPRLFDTEKRLDAEFSYPTNVADCIEE